MFILTTLVGCSSSYMEKKYPTLVSIFGEEKQVKSNEKQELVNSLMNEHPADEQYNWPIKDAPELLASTKQGEMVDAETPDGKPVVFAVLSEYPSAGKKFCKKYFVNLDLNLACFNPHWYPVRSFDEQ